MKHSILKSISLILFLLSFILLMVYFQYELNMAYALAVSTKLFIFTSLTLTTYLAGIIWAFTLEKEKRKAFMKFILIILFCLYVFLLLNLTIFDQNFGRYGLQIHKWTSQKFQDYIDTSLNLVPFKTISNYIRGYQNGHVSFRNLFINLGGNTLAFMPFAIYLPLLFSKTRKFKNFFLVMIGIVSFIEITQLVGNCGSCDIDDLILNVLGACFMYLLLKPIVVEKVLRKGFFS